MLGPISIGSKSTQPRRLEQQLFRTKWFVTECFFRNGKSDLIPLAVEAWICTLVRWLVCRWLGVWGYPYTFMSEY